MNRINAKSVHFTSLPLFPSSFLYLFPHPLFSTSFRWRQSSSIEPEKEIQDPPLSDNYSFSHMLRLEVRDSGAGISVANQVNKRLKIIRQKLHI